MYNGHPNTIPYSGYQPTASIGSHHMHDRRSATAMVSQNPPLLQRNISLPSGRLSPLVDEDESLPPQPFAYRPRLDDSLLFGGLRELPGSRRPHRSRSRAGSELRNTATSPAMEEFMMVVDVRGRQHGVSIRPTSGATAVSVSDVIEAVEVEMRRAERQRAAGGGYPYYGQWVRRGHDGIWMWSGLAEANNEHDVWILEL